MILKACCCKNLPIQQIINTSNLFAQGSVGALESEILAEWAVEFLNPDSDQRGTLQVYAGSGFVGVLVAHAFQTVGHGSIDKLDKSAFPSDSGFESLPQAQSFREQRGLDIWVHRAVSVG
jgi:hypothetical protein